MNKTDEILESLSRQKAKIENPDELTDFIMASLPEVRNIEPKQPHNITTSLIRTISGIAALWLIGLFIYQTIDTNKGPQPYASAEPIQGEKYQSCTLELLFNSHESSNTLSYVQIKQKYNEKN